MAVTLDDKKRMVASLKEVADRSISVVVSEHSGLKVSEMTLLRQQARANNVHLQVVRNRVAKLAFDETKFASLSESLVGSSLVACSFEAPSEAARLIKSFNKEHKDALQVKMISLGDGNLGPDQLNMVASMPTRDEALSLVAMLLQAPARSIAISVKDVPGRLVRVIAAVAEQKQANV